MSNVRSIVRHHWEVAGGMNKRGSWGPMSRRVTQNASAPDAEGIQVEPIQPLREPTQGPSGMKHCWIDDEHGRLPGFLLEWRRSEAGFQGRVVRPVRDPEWGWVVVEEWLPAALLCPA